MSNYLNIKQLERCIIMKKTDKIDEYIKWCNLDLTNPDEDYDDESFANDVQINYDNCVSLFSLASSFNSLYISFKKELDRLPKLDIGSKVDVIKFLKRKSYRNLKHELVLDNVKESRKLELFICNPIFADLPAGTKSTYFYLEEQDDQIVAYATNNLYHDDSFFIKDVDFDKKIAKQYLDLFEKYNLLLEIYHSLKGCILYGNGDTMLSINIDDWKSNLLRGLNELTVSTSTNCGESYTEIVLKLGEDFGIEYNKCKMEYELEPMEITKEDYSNVLTNVYVNKEHTKGIYN